MNKLWLVLCVVLLSSIAVVNAGNYTITGAKDFDVYIDDHEYMSGFIYGTISINQTSHAGDWKCVNMIYHYGNATGAIRGAGGALTEHVQSNPPHSPQNRIAIFSNPAPSPEILGYFPVPSGLGNMYIRSDDIIPYNEFYLIVLCNQNGTQLVYEESISPVWKEALKSLPSRGVWFAKGGNATMIVFAIAVLFIVFLFIYNKFYK